MSEICLKSINELLTGKDGKPARFYIPAYQRGYRWGKDQVTQLLDDIWEFIQASEGKKNSFYCLQPLVMKCRESGDYEIVDGQQRLTTIYILLTVLKKQLDALDKQRFSLHFDTKGAINEHFLDNIDLLRAHENIDFFHICQVFKAAENWFQNRDGTHKIKLLQHLLHDDEAGRNVKVIWFQLSQQDDAVAAFTRLNVGKIPLNNDELIRALFLRRSNKVSLGADGTNARVNLQLKIAYEWDQIEKALQDKQ